MFNKVPSNTTANKKKQAAMVALFDQTFQPKPDYSHEHAETLWLRVIENALIDATLGVSAQLSVRGTVYKSIRTGHWTATPLEILQARRFIKGKDSSLLDICAAIGMDYDVTKEMLLRQYRLCQPHLPKEWQDKNYLPETKNSL